MPNNKTQQFSCNIDFRSSGDSEGMMDGENTLPAASDFKAIRIVLSDHHDNTTITINNINNINNACKESAPTWLIVTAIAGAIGIAIALIMCLCKGLDKRKKIRDEWKNIKDYISKKLKIGSYAPLNPFH